MFLSMKQSFYLPPLSSKLTFLQYFSKANLIIFVLKKEKLRIK